MGGKQGDIDFDCTEDFIWALSRSPLLRMIIITVKPTTKIMNIISGGNINIKYSVLQRNEV